MATIGAAASRIQEERKARAAGATTLSGEAWTRATDSQAKIPEKKTTPSMTSQERTARTMEANARRGVSGSNTAAAPTAKTPSATTSRGRVFLDAGRQASSGGERYAWGRDASSRAAAKEREMPDYRRAVELNRLDQERRRLENQQRQAAADLDTETLNRTGDALKWIRAAQGKQTAGDRASDVLSGSIQNYGTGMANAAGTGIQALWQDPERSRRQISSLQKRLADGGYSDGKQFHRDSEAVRQRLRDSIREMADEAWKWEHGQGAAARLQSAADRMQDDSAKSIASAKEGAGALGQLAVDVGVAGTQMGMDALTAALTGGSALIPMAVRSFGGGAQEARRSGADLDRQLLYGAGSAALSVGTEKISNIAKPFKKMFGAGAAETIAGALVRRFGESGAVQMMQKLSQTATGRIALSAIGEGGEEVVEDVLQPFLKRATFDPNARFDAGEAGNDFLVGAILGALGGVPEAVGRIGSKPARNQAETATGAKVQVPAGVETARAETGLQGVQSGTVEPLKVGRVTTIKRPYQGQTPVQAPKNAAAVQVDSGSVERAQNRINGARGLEGTPIGEPGGFKATLKKKLLESFRSANKVKVDGVTFNGTPYLVDINNSVVGKIINDKNLSAEKISLLDVLQDVVKQGEYVGSGEYESHGSKAKDTVRFDYFETPVSIDGEDYIAKFDVEAFPSRNNYKTHQLVKMELSQTAHADVGPAPTALTAETTPVEGTRPLNSDFTIPQPSDSVKSRDVMEQKVQRLLGKGTEGVQDPLMQAIFSNGKRIEQSALTGEQFARLAELSEQGTVGMDADGRVYQVDPAEHIDRRESGTVGRLNLNAFQYDHPELAGYYKEAAKILLDDIDHTQRGGEIYSYQSANAYNGQGYARMKRMASLEVSELLDGGMSYSRIEKALDAIINDHGAENYADAKRVELLLDRMLTDGFQGVGGWVDLAPNEAYIREKGQIAGAVGNEAGPGALDGIDEIGNDGLGAADADSLNTGFDRMQARTDEFHPINENSARRIMEEQNRAPSEVPVINPETGRNVTKTVSTILNSPLTSPEMAVEIERAVTDGKFDYLPVTDKSAVQRAQADIADRGLNRVADEFLTKVDLGQRITKNELTAAIECYNQALAAGDKVTAFDLGVAISEVAHDGAQMLQAMNLLNRLTPEGKLLTLRRYVDKLNRNADAKATRKSGRRTVDEDAARADFVEQATGFRISDELATEYLMAETDAERSAAWDAITTNLAEQIPSTFREKANFFRYTSMLLNPTTHVRNFAGNAIQAGARTIKNGLGAAIERAVISDPTQRTKSILTGKEGRALRDFALGQYGTDQDAAMGAGKYSDGSARGIEREILNKKKAFQGSNPLSRGIQAVGDFNTRAMDAEDVWFNRPAYVDSFAQALKAKGVTAAEAASGAKADLVAQARAYAIEEAQRATYRNTTALSEALSSLGNYRGNNPVKQAGSFAVDAFLPFRRTPANILTTGMDYSPLGILKAAKQGLYDLKRGNATAADVVDSLSAGLTGTGIMALGAWLAAEGLLRVSLGDDDREEAYNKDRGAQKYALQIGGKSYTLDWASPSAMPLLAGASVMESAMDGGSTFEAVMDAMTGISDVVLETSMLSSLNDLISNWSYAKNKVTYVLDRAASGYLGQYVPTIGGKIASLADDTVRKSYVETGTGQVASDVDYFLQGVEKKIPGARNTLQPKIDLWGEEVSNGKLPERVFKNFLSPGYLNAMDSSALDLELRRLSEAVGSSSVYPTAVGKSFTVNGERKELTAEEYTQYARKVGQTRRQLVEELMNSEGYKKLDDANRAAVIASAYEYAGDLGKMEVSRYVPRSGGVTEGALKSPLPTAVYLLYRNSSDRDGNGSTSAAESTQTLMELDGLTDKERGEAWSAFNNKGETEEARERKEAQNPFTGVLSKDYSPEDALGAWEIFNGKGTREEPYTREQKKKDLGEELGISQKAANDLYELMRRAANQ